MANRTRAEKGFSYIDVMIAVTILLIGILTLGGALTVAVVRSTESEGALRAKQYGRTALESVLAARYMSIGATEYDFDSIQNSPDGVFPTGFQRVYETPGPDGLIGTLDDDQGGQPAIESYTREISIRDIQNPNRPSPPNPITEREITITVRYVVNGITRDEVLVSRVTNY